MEQDYFKTEKGRRAQMILDYLREQRQNFGTQTLNLLDDSGLAYFKHAWNDKGIGVGNCQAVGNELPILLGELRRRNLVEIVYKLKEES